MTDTGRILVVEDTPSQAELIRAMLAGSGYEVRIAASAGAGFAEAQTWNPDVILLDLDLPDYSGRELLQQIRQEPINSPVIVITTDGSQETTKQLMREGAFDYFTKPFNKAKVMATVNNCLEDRTREAEKRAQADERSPTDAPRILIVEDTPSQAELVRAMLAGSGYELRLAASAGAAFAAAQAWRPDAILLDLDLPDYSGLELLQQFRREAIESAVIVMTADTSQEERLMREGALDYIIKPLKKARVTVTLSNCLELCRARRRLGSLGFVGRSPPMQAACRTIEAVATSRASVFITGESGTGKELVAEAVHRASRRRGRFIALNCGAIPRDLLESEVFGHVKGAFTGATDTRIGAAKAADGGTLFLDEIGEMPLDMQVKLLRFVQTGSFTPVGGSRPEKVDVRFVCATNRDPLVEVQEGRFREDLFYRLYVVPVELPPLRARGDDVLLIARHFLKQFAQEERRRFISFAPEAERILLAYNWPGNVRQLQNVVRNIAVMNDDEVVSPAMLPPILLRGPGSPPKAAAVQRQVISAPALPAERPTVPPPAPEPTPTMPVVEPEAQRDRTPAVDTPSPPAWAFEPPRMRSEPPEEFEIVPLAVMEKRMILAALARTGNDVPRAAALLQVNPSTIYRKLQGWKAVSDPVGA
jgi:two-component system repressor protein LuxO